METTHLDTAKIAAAFRANAVNGPSHFGRQVDPAFVAGRLSVYVVKGRVYARKGRPGATREGVFCGPVADFRIA